MRARSAAGRRRAPGASGTLRTAVWRQCARRSAPPRASRRLAQGAATQQQGHLRPGRSSARSAPQWRRRPPAAPRRAAADWARRPRPRDIGRQDQRRHLPRQAAARGDDGVDGIAAQGRRLREVRTKPGETLRATVSMSGLQLRVQRHVVGGVIADDVQQRHLALARVVQVGWPGRCRGRSPDAAGSPPACRPCARSRRRRRWPRPRTGSARRAGAVTRRPARRRSASRSCLGW